MNTIKGLKAEEQIMQSKSSPVTSTMKNLIITVLSCWTFAAALKAQTAEHAIAQVKYRLIWVRDTNDRNRPYTEDLLLLLGKSSSSYSSIDAQKQEEVLSREVQDQIKKASNPNSLDLVITGRRPVSAEEYFQFLAGRKLFTCHRLNNNYLTEEPLPIINWNISTDTTNIHGFHCQKATAHFKGRDYIAWFCADLPIHTGPWMLNGLPGLIIQAADAKNEVVFQFVSFQDISDKSLTVELPQGVIRASKKEVNRLIELKQKDPAAYAKLPAANISGPLSGLDPSRIKSVTVNSPSMNFGKVVNNPIELPERK